MEVFTMHDGANAEPAGTLYSETMLVFFDLPRCWKPSKVIHPERLEERGDVLRVEGAQTSVREHGGG